MVSAHGIYSGFRRSKILPEILERPGAARVNPYKLPELAFPLPACPISNLGSIKVAPV